MDKGSVLIVSGQHFATQSRKVDLHFMADAFRARGMRTDFLTLRLSQVSRLIGDGRWQHARDRTVNAWVDLAPDQAEFIWVNLVHPLSLGRPAADRLSGLLFRHYGEFLPRAVLDRLPSYRTILIESGISVLLIHAIRMAAPAARIIYHAADRLATIGTHPAAAEHLARHAGDIDLAHIMAEAIRGDVPAGVPVIYLPHGLDKARFDAAANPYAGPGHAVSVGDMLFDGEAIRVMAEAAPRITFHLFGRLARIDDAPGNVIAHGERPFEEIAGYIRHADLGIAPYRPTADADYLSQSSMKMIQYTWCRLPILAPDFAAAGRAHVLAYRPGEPDTIRAALARALAFDRSSIDTSTVLGWDEKVDQLLAAADAAATRRTAA